MEDTIAEICKAFKIMPSIISPQPSIRLGNFTAETMDIIVDYKLLAGENITKELHAKKLLSENLRIELI